MRTPHTTRLAFRLTPLVAAIACVFTQGASAAVTPYQVTNTGDAGTGTLRQAIVDANTDCNLGVNSSPVITFNIATGPFVIMPSTALPTFQCISGVYTPTVDGTTQSGWSANTDSVGFNAALPVVLDGSLMLAYGGGDGLAFSSFYGGVLTVRGLELMNFNTALYGNLFVTGNYLHNNAFGVRVDTATGSGTAIGGLLTEQHNLFWTNGTAISVSNVSNISVTENNFSTNSFGIDASTVSNLTVLANRFGYNQYAISGISVTGGSISENFIGSLDTATVAGNTTFGIDWNQSTGTISNNYISGNLQAGVHLFGDGGTVVSGNRIGTDNAGVLAQGNGWGMLLDFSYGADIHDNVISGNLYGGILATNDGNGVSGSYIHSNKIGTDITGMVGIGNGGAGGISLNSSSNTIVRSNVISGNAGGGIDLLDTADVLIKDNTIGANNNATAPIGNVDGIIATCARNLTIQDNLVGGNTNIGIALAGVSGPSAPPPPALAAPGDGLKRAGGKRAKAESASNILYNRVGVVNFSTPMPNGGHGIYLGFGDCSFSYPTGYNGLLQNWVANNGGMGITIQAGVGNTMSQNTVYDNVVKNIDLNNNYGGPLPNDVGGCTDPIYGGPVPGSDCDGGPNNQQNYPDILGVTQSGGSTTVAFTLHSTPNRAFHVEIFDNLAMPSLPAGRQYRADTFVTTDANGDAPAGSSYTIGSLTNFITLTATDEVTGDTSEYSPVGSYTPVPAVNMSATALDFGTLNVGQTSVPQSVTLTSTGTAPYHINTFDTSGTCYGGPICAGGDFTCTTTCSTSTNYATGQSCTISATYHPSIAGPASSSIFICDNAGTRSLTLLGNGLAAGAIGLAPSTFNFGSVLVGQASANQDFTFTNSGAGIVSLGVISTTGDFNLVTTTCQSQLASNASCKATVQFAPSLPGLRTGSLVMATPVAVARGKVAATVVSASLQGTGTQVAQLDLPASVEFGSLTLGSSTAAISVNVHNSGNAVISFSSIAVSAPFTLTNPCPLNLQPGQTCTLTLGFNPATLGDFSGTLTVVSNASGGSKVIPVSAHVVAQPVPLIRVSPSSIGFGNRMIGTQSAPSRITIRNDGGAAAPLDLTTLSTDFLIAGSSCGLTLAPGASCFADVVFQPAGFGGRSGQFRANNVSVGPDQVTDLAGTGCRPYIPGTARNHQSGGGCAP